MNAGQLVDLPLHLRVAPRGLAALREPAQPVELLLERLRVLVELGLLSLVTLLFDLLGQLLLLVLAPLVDAGERELLLGHRGVSDGWCALLGGFGCGCGEGVRA